MYNSDHSVVDFQEQDGILKVSLKNTIGHDDVLKSELLQMASAVRHHGIKKVLIHNKDLTHPISNELQQWALLSIELPLLQSGVDKIAIIKPAGNKAFALAHFNDTGRKKYFSTEKAAMKWFSED